MTHRERVLAALLIGNRFSPSGAFARGKNQDTHNPARGNMDVLLCRAQTADGEGGEREQFVGARKFVRREGIPLVGALIGHTITIGAKLDALHCFAGFREVKCRGRFSIVRDSNFVGAASAIDRYGQPRPCGICDIDALDAGSGLG